MNKTAVIGTFCFLMGIGAGFLLAPKKYQVELSAPVFKELTSQGRSEMRSAFSEINLVLNGELGEIIAEKTKMLQAITAKEQNRIAADFYLSGMESKMSALQSKIDTIFLNAVQRMPLLDRRTYMTLFLKNRHQLRLYGIAFPLIAETGDPETKPDSL